MAGSFADYAGSRRAARFTDWLRDGAEPHWGAATTHRFTRALADDALDDAVFRRYLIQDYAFIASLASLVGFAVGHAPAMAQKARLTRFLAVLTDEENAYFLRSFAALGVEEAVWRGAECAPVTRRLADLLAEAVADGGYDEILAVLTPVEWVYLTWARAEEAKRPSRFYYAEWITLHADPGFGEFVEWMRDELDRRGPALPAGRQTRLADLFRRACALEVEFFDAAYGNG